jgi:hypothetical protein
MNKLPKLWYCKCLDENQREIFVKWRKGNYSGTREQSVMTNEPCWYYLSQVKNSHTEISFETFERLVLGINREKHYELW